MKRTLKINFVDGTSKELDLVGGSKIMKTTEKQFIYFDKRKDGWRVCWTAETFEEFSDIKSIEIVRNDCQKT